MNTEKELHALIRSYRYTVLVLSGVIVLTMVAFAGIVMVFVPDTIIAAYLLDKEGTLKALAVETAARMTLPNVSTDEDVVTRPSVPLTKKEVDDKKVEIEAEEAAEEARKAAEEAAKIAEEAEVIKSSPVVGGEVVS